MVTRALLLWVLVRIAVMAVAMAPHLSLSFASVVIIVAVIPALCHVDARAMREDLFYANLGRPAWAPAVVGLLAACALELLIAVIVRA
jgi:hypothetical protein